MIYTKYLISSIDLSSQNREEVAEEEENEYITYVKIEEEK